MEEESKIHSRFEVRGRVQGVGFRYFTRGKARELGISGWVRNCADGSVESVASGTRAQIDSFEQALRLGPTVSRVTSIKVSESEADAAGSDSFDIVY